MEAAMAPRAIISYDDTPGDHDALMLGRILADAGASLTLAYVRHCASNDCSQEELEEHEAETLLARGADRLAGLDAGGPAPADRGATRGHRRVRLRLPHPARARRAAAHHPEPARVRAGRSGHRPGRLLRRANPPNRRDRDPRRR